jgi:hypothetical protein
MGMVRAIGETIQIGESVAQVRGLVRVVGEMVQVVGGVIRALAVIVAAVRRVVVESESRLLSVKGGRMVVVDEEDRTI